MPTASILIDLASGAACKFVRRGHSRFEDAFLAIADISVSLPRKKKRPFHCRSIVTNNVGAGGLVTLEHRERLIDHMVESQPGLGAFIRRLPHDLMAGSRDLLSYSFQRGFEVMWDQARTDASGLLLRPLLLLWRQSVELAIKASIMKIAGTIKGRPGHDIQSCLTS